MHDELATDFRTIDSERWLAITVVGTLDAAAQLGYAGLALGLINLYLVAQTATTPHREVIGIEFVVIAVLAAQLWLGVRIAIDRRLFGALALVCPSPDLKALDAALAEFGWRPSCVPDRPFTSRAKGALRFLNWAGTLTVLQLIMAAASLLCLLLLG